MTLELTRSFLAWCSLINMAILLFYWLFFMIFRKWIYSMHGKWFNLAEDRFYEIHYKTIIFYKTGIILFNLIPYFALRIISN